MSSKIPVVDLGELGSSNEPAKSEWERVGREVCQAFSSIGFVYLKNHGIPNKAIDELNSSSEKFFQLDDNIKKKYERGILDIQGYTAVDREKLSAGRDVLELRESYDVKKVDGLFPDAEVSTMRSTVATFVDACKGLTRKVLVAMAIGLDLDPEFFVSTHQLMCSDTNATCLRILYYPKIPRKLPPNTTRCGSHTDYGTVTFLFQDDVGGLQVKDTSGEWVNADPVPEAVLVNVGDILQFWTSDRLKATEHRVLIPPEEACQENPRRSVVFFVHPDDSVVITPLDGSSSYQPITAKEHTDARFRETYVY